MRRWTWVGVAAAFALLMYGTVLVFRAFDSDSHSVSDTIRPFLITMGPVWVLALGAAAILVQARGLRS